ncbi:hypothetical protein OPQ81_008628 [Rhizoctonia solani]|nr:hypothetical protein OPQ81_008628 [Rhizoctonia solani]
MIGSKFMKLMSDSGPTVACNEATQSPESLHEASKALVAWWKTALQTLEVDDPPFLNWEQGLKQLWEELGFELEADATRKAHCGIKPKFANNLPTRAEMESAFEYYIEEYCNGVASVENLPVPGLLYGVQDLSDGGIDLGVEHLKDWTLEKL